MPTQSPPHRPARRAPRCSPTRWQSSREASHRRVGSSNHGMWDRPRQSSVPFMHPVNGSTPWHDARTWHMTTGGVRSNGRRMCGGGRTCCGWTASGVGWNSRRRIPPFAWAARLRIGELIPGGCGPCNDRRVACCDGTWHAHPPPMCRRPAPGRRARWLEIREACCDRCRRSASNGCGVRRPPRGTWPASRSSERASRLQLAAVPKIAATRVPQGDPGDPKGPGGPSPRALEQARPGLLGPEDNRPSGRREAPAYPSRLAPPPAARERNGVWGMGSLGAMYKRRWRALLSLPTQDGGMN